jgi:acyl carrier protein
MDGATIEEVVRTIVHRLGKVEPNFSADADIFRELGLKSAAGLDLLLSLETEFGITIVDEDFLEARTTAKLVALVKQLQAGVTDSA